MSADSSTKRGATLEAVLARCQPDGECLIWPGALNGRRGSPDARPKMQVDGKTITLSRWVLVASGGDMGPTECARMTCRNSLCLAPWHLYAAPKEVTVRDTKRVRPASDDIVEAVDQLVRRHHGASRNEIVDAFLGRADGCRALRHVAALLRRGALFSVRQQRQPSRLFATAEAAARCQRPKKRQQIRCQDGSVSGPVPAATVGQCGTDYRYTLTAEDAVNKPGYVSVLDSNDCRPYLRAVLR